MGGWRSVECWRHEVKVVRLSCKSTNAPSRTLEDLSATRRRLASNTVGSARNSCAYTGSNAQLLYHTYTLTAHAFKPPHLTPPHWSDLARDYKPPSPTCVVLPHPVSPHSTMTSSTATASTTSCS